MPDLLSFVAVASLIAITPGADMALVARNTLAGGRRHGVVTTAGILCGIVVHGFAALLGLSALIASSSSAYQIVKSLGAAYLILLGLQTLWRLRQQRPVVAPELGEDRGVHQQRRPFTEGLMTNVLNPKISVLFLSLMPQFINGHSSAAQQILILTITFLAIGVIWLSLYVVFIHRVRAVFSRTTVRERIDAIVGTVLVAFGLRLLTNN